MVSIGIQEPSHSVYSLPLWIIVGSAPAKIDFNIVGIPQDNDQASYEILQTIQSLEVCRQMMMNKDKNYYKVTLNYPSYYSIETWRNQVEILKTSLDLVLHYSCVNQHINQI